MALNITTIKLNQNHKTALKIAVRISQLFSNGDVDDEEKLYKPSSKIKVLHGF